MKLKTDLQNDYFVCLCGSTRDIKTFVGVVFLQKFAIRYW